MAGGEVTQVQVDYAFGLAIETYDEQKASTHIRISTRFEYEADGVVTVDRPGAHGAIGPTTCPPQGGRGRGLRDQGRPPCRAFR